MRLHRQNSDTRVNNYGYRLIDFCIDNDMYIINGRGDGNSSDVTCENVSTVDYFISTASVIPIVECLNVHECCKIFSDSHKPVSLVAKLGYRHTRTEHDTNLTPQTKLWDAEKAQTFVHNFKASDIDQLCSLLDDLSKERNVSQGDVNEVIDSLNEIFISNCRSSFGITVSNNQKGKPKNDSWFNNECKTARKNFHSAKFRYKLRKNFENKCRLNSCSKQYKKTLRKAQVKYKNEKIKAIRKLKKSDPRKYWKFLNGNKQSEINLTLDKAHEYFSKVSNNDEHGNSEINFENASLPENDEINIPITEEEIKKAVKSLKNNKSSGIDLILNEHIKCSFELSSMRQLYVKLFNIVFDTGIIPEAWAIGKIIPIYKQKGEQNDPSNYRPITLLSCMGKLFTAVINNRLYTYSEKYNKINECQAGFRKKFSTTDHIFALDVLVNIIQSSKRKLFCGFIDLKGAFDSVWRSGLLYKVQQFNITGKCFQLIKSMYDGIKSCVSINGKLSDFFPSNIGVRQGENLSPFLFTIFLNDLENFLSESNVKGVELEDNIFNYLKIFLLYADDTVILSESSSELQEALDFYASYCRIWKLKINNTKTKVVVFFQGQDAKL